ncbi:MAG: hypothetical protein A3C93_01330 [Candidatus Lloydbacteria bacterium RIFCSPHIGHO2_02_FULL_54_17]|uniref:L,D-TPase catalytic domain-containing protein n=1 Tax=Candidatus Lloydbacteria bacterium RIFCSPHIGHO2_02_FULL_54_17 TaxID=1798664 RepID=A0A1G2DGT7_9BACT|nr:MAG: hypothetical protein A2762_00095 [Candidatus Lloydbacteria bacterium RIFCSPHIGHO2_01_FULL_54_11]OGZ11998.1 MAG: hypothetical protein A3C93_01330 [Candidatus Lloydbacteria bacterium RIFCSPHIGHO2_02_FULL_54_17]
MHRVSRKYALLVLSFLMGFLSPMIISLVTSRLYPAPHDQEPQSLVAEAYLADEEAVVIAPENDDEESLILPVTKVMFEYIGVVEGCGPHFEGECVNVRSGPGEDYPVVTRLRNGMVLKVGGKVERDGRTWYKIVFDEWVRYPNRVKGSWYVVADYVEVLLDEGDRGLEHAPLASSTKRIVVERGKQKLFAYNGEELYMETSISTGLLLTPTPRGTFTIFKKTPSRYMQGPIPGIAEQYYDLPGVPWNLYFTEAGGAIHGAYWHDKFGRKYSHGCVNLPPEQARQLYLWADIGTQVVVKD